MNRSRKSALTLGAVALVCVLPVAASYLAYYFWPPRAQVNYGELIEPVTLPDGIATLVPEVRGRWTLVYASEGRCEEACAQALYYMRQVRTAQAEHMDRVERLWLRGVGDGAPDAALLAAHPGLRVTSVARAALHALPATGQVMLLDPLGKLMMRFPSDPDPKRMIRDLARLLKYSRLG